MKNMLRAVLAASLALTPAGAFEPRAVPFDTPTGATKTFGELVTHFPPPPGDVAYREIPPGEDFVGLKAGHCDAKGNGPIHRLRVVLRRWNVRLDLGADPRCYTEELAASLTLFKAIYGSGIDGHSVDLRTAALLGGMELDPSRVEPQAPRQFPGGEVLYWASRHLGKPYQMGADGVLTTDCGMLTRLALMAAGLVAPGFTRLADLQYLSAQNLKPLSGKRSKGALRLALRQVPSPGSLVFFRNATYQSSIAYDGVTHVGLFIAVGGLGPHEGYILHAASRGVVIDKLYYADRSWIPGFGEILAR